MGCSLGLPHPKILMTTVQVANGMSLAYTEAFSELMTDIYWMGERDDPPYLKIQRFHEFKLEVHLTSGGKEEDFKCRIRKGLLNDLIMRA
jgi:hypothetical protein